MLMKDKIMFLKMFWTKIEILVELVGIRKRFMVSKHLSLYRKHIN